jgi:hypothetical protein
MRINIVYRSIADTIDATTLSQGTLQIRQSLHLCSTDLSLLTVSRFTEHFGGETRYLSTSRLQPISFDLSRPSFATSTKQNLDVNRILA